MRLLKPLWVTHGPLLKDSSISRPIYCLDIHPDGSRLATGGLMDTCGVVILWNMHPIRTPKLETDSNVPRKLFQMDSHQACVNCVRWSPSGYWLASAGMDKVVMLWKKISTASRQTTVFGSKEQTTFTEHWRCISVLRGHTGDILDLAWSHDGYRLASAGVDNNVIIWAHQMSPNNPGASPFAMLTTLKGHQGFVKGLAWDPVGRYLASQGDEISVKIWRTSDWKEETVIKKPFSKAVGQSQVMRISWSLDGSTLAAPHAINNGFPTAKLIDRTNWGSAFDLVGHRKHVICARYCPNLFRKSKENASQDLACLALGSKDRSVSVWTTVDRRALVVIHDLFTNSVCDLSWSSNGRELMACSLDGTVSYMEFTANELGTPWSTKDLVHLHHKLYGQSLLDSLLSEQAPGLLTNLVVPCKVTQNGPDQTDIVLETPEALALQQIQADVQQRLQTVAPKSAVQPTRPQGPSKQIETRAKDGRRRIIPKFLGHLDSMDEDTGSNPQFQKDSPTVQTDKTPTQSDSSPVAKTKSPEQPIAASVDDRKSNLKDSSSLPTDSPHHLARPDTSTPLPAPHAKSAPPDSNAFASPPCLTIPLRRLTDLPKDSPTTTNEHAEDRVDTMPKRTDQDPEVDHSPKSKALSKQKKRRRLRLFEDDESDKNGHPETNESASHARSKVVSSMEKEFVCPGSVVKDDMKRSVGANVPICKPSLCLVPDQFGKETKAQFVCSHPVEGPILVELCSQKPAQPTAPTNLRVYTESPGIRRVIAGRNDRTIWEVLNEHPITSYAYTNHVVCIGDAAGRIHLLHINGNRLCCPILLDSAVHRLSLRSLSESNKVAQASGGESVASFGRLHSVISGHDLQQVNGSSTIKSDQCTDYQLIALCQSGRLCVWSVRFPSLTGRSGSSLFSSTTVPTLLLETNIREVINGEPSSKLGFSSLIFTVDGYPVIHRQDGSSFMFHLESRCWLELFNAANKIRCLAALKSYPSCPSGPLASYQLLNKLQGNTSNHKLENFRTDTLSSEHRATVQRFFEDQSRNALDFGSSAEFRYWFTQWFRSLVENNQEDMIRNVCQDLIGPVYSTSRTSWHSTIKDIPKHELMKELLSLFALNMRLQRLYVETKELLEQSESQLTMDS